MGTKENKKNTGITAAIVIVITIVLVILFLIKRDDIISNLKKTNFFERVGVSTPEFVKNHEISQDDEQESEEIEIDLLGTGTQTVKKDNTTNEKAKDSSLDEESQNKEDKTVASEQKDKEASDNKDGVAAKENKPAVQEEKTVETPKAVVSTRNTVLCFVTIESDGSVSRKMVTRALPKTGSPLTEAIKALLEGPLPQEQSKNAMTLIPSGTKLIGASVKNGVATLNFNDTFEFNSYGVEGCIGQLMQIVYTATEFSTVNSVQFLIEGEKKDYLGIEGQWIGTPLSRANF